MTNNSGHCIAKVATPTTHAYLHHHRDSFFPEQTGEAQPQQLCLLLPPLHQVLAFRLASSEPLSVVSHRSRRKRSLQLSDSERSNSPLKEAPTPTSSPAAGPCNTTHSVRETTRAGKRRPKSEAARESVRLHKRPETADQSSAAEYKLIMVQEPTTGSAFEDNLLGRIGLAPPLILELQVVKDGRQEDVSAELPFMICQCSLLDKDGNVADMVDQTVGRRSPSTGLVPPTPPTRGRGDRASSTRRGTSASAVSSRSTESADAAASTGTDENLSTGTTATQLRRSVTVQSSGQDSPQLARMLYGTIVAGPQQYKSVQDEQKPYFFFPEISVRTPGKFKIQCKLMRLSLPGLSESDAGVLASTETHVFEVVKRSDYTAPYITDISRHFARQGVPLLLPPGVSAD